MTDNHSPEPISSGRIFAHMRRPVIDENAEQRMSLLLLGFAGSVVVTRLFLKWTGYPQIASGDFHIAHVLWGGLLLFVAALLLLVWRGRNISWLSSLLTGIGFGLFIDEVGKFITVTNDYFYPLAAPIIYAFFLLTVFIYSRIRNLRTGGAQIEVYRIMDILEQGIDPNISAHEFRKLRLRLDQIAAQSVRPNVALLAGNVIRFLDAENFPARPTKSGFIDRWKAWLHTAQARWVNQTRFKRAIIFGFILLAIRGLLAAIAAVLFVNILLDPTSQQQLASQPWAGDQLFGTQRLILVTVVLIADGLIGGWLLTAAGFMIAGKLRRGLSLGYWGLLFSLTAVHLLIFYFGQFDFIMTTLLQFSLLLGIIYYRSRYLP